MALAATAAVLLWCWRTPGPAKPRWPGVPLTHRRPAARRGGGNPTGKNLRFLLRPSGKFAEGTTPAEEFSGRTLYSPGGPHNLWPK